MNEVQLEGYAVPNLEMRNEVQEKDFRYICRSPRNNAKVELEDDMLRVIRGYRRMDGIFREGELYDEGCGGGQQWQWIATTSWTGIDAADHTA